MQVELVDRYDKVTGLKAIVYAHGCTPRGVNPAELAVLGPDYADELRKRGFSLTVS